MIRIVNRLLALLIGSALAAAAFVTLVNGVLNWSRGDFVWIPGREWLRAFRSTTWSAPMVVGISAAVGAFGAVLVVVELWPERRRLLPYKTGATGDWLVTRRSAEAQLERRLTTELPATAVKARLDARATHWTLKIRARALDSAGPALEARARAQLLVLHAPASSRVQLRTVGDPRQNADVPGVAPMLESP